MTTTMAILLALANDTPPTPHAIRPEIPVALSQLVTALLEKQPDNRPHSAEAVLAELRRIAEQPIQKIVTSTTTHAGEVLVPSVLSLEDS
ncbi:MAG TPA: hypothetical protein PK992_09145, partial [Planctomycetaceae bacterium]|nr:hypothetical protein [Planctomycetaceae bacterium]